MKPMQVEALTDATNYAVIRLPNRAFPGVVFQGDSLSILYQNVEDVRAVIDAEDLATAREEIGYVCDELRGLLEYYEATLAAEGLELPYYRD